ncbi:DNA-directed RNA polymerase III subunit rpc6-like [Salvia splendens]|uniref:DNA-directed RNA polymerase III subunit rpc6-like n=1 Tax=Salvia splendens TaxID=180675 RepID=UPI001C26AE0B|nr:DNA-directed RNA polymerase III subunit rpc6-like [Salvia splendens]XP_042039042.1 DNA-directed RNA polymerase III subunit rpc6-like [Salvia splendens]
MNRAVVTAGKRKRASEPPLTRDEQQILDLILSKEGSGIQPREIKYQLKIPDPVITKANKTLLAKNLIKEVKGIQRGGAARKIFMGFNFTPSDVVSGGVWYEDGKIDTEFVNGLKMLCLSMVRKSKVTTLEGLHKFVKEAKVAKVEIPKLQLDELLTSMVLEKELVEVKSTGMGAFCGIRIGETCYKLPTAGRGVAKGSITGAFASIPCGACPRIDLCTPDGVISPTTCVYFNQWDTIDDHCFSQ